MLPFLPSLNLGESLKGFLTKAKKSANEVADFAINIGSTIRDLQESNAIKWMKKERLIVTKLPKIEKKIQTWPGALLKTFAPAIPDTYEKMKEGKPLFQAYKDQWEEAEAEERILEIQTRNNYEYAKKLGASSWELAKIANQSPSFQRMVGMGLSFIGGMKIITPEDDLIAAIKAAKPAREFTEELYTAERAIRAEDISKVFEQVPGEKGYYTALGRLKGKLPKLQFEPIKPKFGQGTIDYLFDKIKYREAPGFDAYKKLTTQTGLSKILMGEVPTRGELSLLDDVFGPELSKTVLAKRSTLAKFGDYVKDALNVPRSLMVSMDMSAFLRQGAILVVDEPAIGFKAFPEMVKYFGSERLFKEGMDEIMTRPTYPLMKQSGLELTEMGVNLTKREEVYTSQLAEKIPILGRLVKASERAYVGFLNKMRADVFDDLVNTYTAGGVTPTNSPQVYDDLARFLNVATGRGELGKFATGGTVWNTVFFAPRFMMARAQMLNPKWYLSLHPVARKEVAKAFIKFVGTGIGILTLAKLGGADVETDPRSSDFGKIKIGNARWDIWGGFQQWTRITSQLILGATKSSTTGKIWELKKGQYPDITRWTQFIRFFRGKLAPIPALVTDLMEGENVIGEEVSLGKTFYEKLTPIYIQDLIEGMEDMGMIAIPAIGIPGFFGIGTQVYGARPSKDTGKLNVPKLPALPKLPKIGR